MPEWEERKYLLAQRRVESIRLLTVLLSQIKNFVLSSRQAGEPPEGTGNEREDSFPARPVRKVLKQKTNSCYLLHQDPKDEKKPECPSVDLDISHAWEEEEEKQQCIAREEPASPCALTRTVLNKPAAQGITSHFVEKDTSGRRAGGFLQVTLTQGGRREKSPHRGDGPQPRFGSSSGATEAGEGKKQKVYETEEFIHYLLNYYQTPRYARVCPRVQNPVDPPRWQRAVSDRGNGFQVTLKNRGGRFLTTWSLVPDRTGRDSREDYSSKQEVIGRETEAVQTIPNSRAWTREFAKSYQGQWEDSLEEAADKTSPVGWDARIVGCPGIACNVKYQEEKTRTTGASSHKPFGHRYKLKDLLEEISSDSEYFSEAMNETLSRTERRNGGCRSSGEVWPLSTQQARELLVCVQNVACGNQGGEGTRRSFGSSSEYYGPRENPGQQLKMTFKRPTRLEGQNIRWLSSEDEREAGRKEEEEEEDKKKKKKRPSSNSLPDGGPSFLRANHCGELESLGKIQRKYTKVFHHHKMKCKTLPAVKAKGVLPLSASQLQEGHLGAGDLRRATEADSEGGPLFPVELIRKSPHPESRCGTDLERGY